MKILDKLRPARWMAPLAAPLILAAALPAAAAPPVGVPMHNQGSTTFYVKVNLPGWGDADFLVDTGSSHTTIGEPTLEKLQKEGKARYLRNLVGTLADGSQMVVPIYRISELQIGGNCSLHNVEAAVFPGSTRNILGLSALTRTAPFRFSMDPPTLWLGQCEANTSTTAMN